VIEEESSPKDTIERFSKLVQQEKVDCVQGIISTGVGLALGPVVEETRALTIYWDGTTQDGVEEKIPNPRYLFRSTDNECEAVMSSLLAIKHWKGKFVSVAGINPDYSYGRNNMAAFVAMLKRFGIEHNVVTEQWPKVGTMDLTSHVAALKAAKPDLIFSSLLFADLPVFMKQAHAAGLTQGTKLVFPAAGWQHTLMKKEFTPEGMLFGHNTLYFANPNASPLAKEFVDWYATTYKDYPEWEADRAYFALASYKAAVEAASKAKGGSWPSQDDVIDALVGLSVESLGGRGSWRKDHIADQTFVQGFTTHDNKYDFVTLGTFETMFSTDLQKPPGGNFWEWIKTAQFKV
jgi:branched-chain amino acid transport system substrate-binding protein